MTIAIILAAGDGERMRRINKIFYRIKGKPLIFYTIEAFEKHPQVDGIILLAKASNSKKFFSLIKKYGFKKIKLVINGGKKRQDSAFNGLKAAEKLGAKSGDLILFHNGANPLVSQNEITDVIRAAKKYKVALVAQPTRDTIKKRDKNGFVVRTIGREKIFLAQTPQVIEYTLAKRAFEEAFAEKFYGTDDVSLVEKLGVKPKIVPASSKNIKVTYPEDLKFVESQL
ncbi:MAG: 2-C-methyl-D-erythritol 4-phosphate cytidylyltransferase [bacterium]|jgi:2-C-methyl-D-erythritol 4-phosphate cytidylyltransferase|nr:2-C-methyl-D-erythritol 4-phosphate cytidylyltransferase [bacterium]